MIGDFNIRDNKWNPLYPHHLHHTNSLKKIADSFNLELLTLVNQVLTWYADNHCDSSSVLDLMFLCSISKELNHHFILSDLWGPSDYALLLVHITIEKEFILEKKLAIVKNSEKEKTFMNNLITRLKNIDMTNIYDQKILEETVKKFTSITEELWYEHTRQVYITKHSKA